MTKHVDHFRHSICFCLSSQTKCRVPHSSQSVCVYVSMSVCLVYASHWGFTVAFPVFLLFFIIFLFSAGSSEFSDSGIDPTVPKEQCDLFPKIHEKCYAGSSLPLAPLLHFCIIAYLFKGPISYIF